MITFPTNRLQKVLLGGGCEQRNLPSGYTQVEYLESSGTQYIDTGVPVSNDLTFGYKASPKITNQLSISQLRPSPAARSGLIVWQAGGSINIRYFSNDLQFTRDTGVRYEINRVFDIIFNDNNNFYIDGSLVYTKTNDIDTLGVLATGVNDRVYNLWIKIDGVLTFNGIPARRNSDNVLGMYDTVTNTFLTNAGRGTFTAGPEAQPSPTTPIDIVCNNGVIKAFKTLNISTYDTTPSNAGIDITFDNVTDKRKWDTLNDNGTGTKHYENGFVSIYMDANGKTYYAKALVNGVVYNGSVYNTGEQIDSWSYTTTKNINIYCPTINTDGTQEVVTDSLGNTANAEMLCAVGDYKDTQEVISGSVTRNVGIKVLDGTENWIYGSPFGEMFCVLNFFPVFPNIPTRLVLSTHFIGEDATPAIGSRNGHITRGQTGESVGIGYSALNGDITAFKQYLADQYNAGTPVIVIYPLATPTTEQVTPQPLTGNTVTQTAGSIDNLPIESSTIAELKKRYIGANEVKRVYIGDNLMWEK